MSATGSEAIKREVRDGILIGTFNRPEALNAVSSQVLDALADLVADFDREPELRVLVLTGAGRAFCSGNDLRNPDPDYDGVREIMKDALLIVRGMIECGHATKEELLKLVAEERARVSGPATREV